MNTTTNLLNKLNKKSKFDIEFDDRTPLWVKLKYKLLSLYFVKKVVWYLFRLVLLVGISYVIIYPFLSMIFGSFMSKEDLLDTSVAIIPKYPTLEIYKAIITENRYFEALLNTTILSLLCAIIQMVICMLVGYGLAKFKFKGNKFFFLCVIFSMIVPHQTLRLAFFMKFRYFDIYGIYEAITKLMGSTFVAPNLINTYWPMGILSFGGLAFKNGLYIFMMRQFYKGVPDELEEAAYVDGSGVIKTFIRIIVPLSVPMMITVFLFAFSWQWTDSFYSQLFFTRTGLYLMPNIISVPASLGASSFEAAEVYSSVIINTSLLLIIAPLIIIYCFCQRYLIQGIERSGIVG